MTYLCHNGHNSTDPDFCSECMEEIRKDSPAPAVQDPLPVVLPVVPTGKCPLCQEPHGDADGQYCLNCGFDFVSKSSGIPPVHVAPSPPPPVVPMPSVVDGGAGSVPSARGSASSVVPSAQSVTLLVEIDPNMLGKPNADAPRLPPRTFDLPSDRSLLGRASLAGVDVVVEKDAAISKKHLEFVPVAGGYKVKDVGSANGTTLNGEALVAHAEYPLKRPLQDGDVVCIGEWTRITIKQR